jgi:hypothetical protein
MKINEQPSANWEIGEFCTVYTSIFGKYGRIVSKKSGINANFGIKRVERERKRRKCVKERGKSKKTESQRHLVAETEYAETASETE